MAFKNKYNDHTKEYYTYSLTTVLVEEEVRRGAKVICNFVVNNTSLQKVASRQQHQTLCLLLIN